MYDEIIDARPIEYISRNQLGQETTLYDLGNEQQNIGYLRVIPNTTEQAEGYYLNYSQ